MNRRLIAAMTAFAILGVLAFFTLDGKMRYGVLLILAYFASRTYISYRAGW